MGSEGGLCDRRLFVEMGWRSYVTDFSSEMGYVTDLFPEIGWRVLTLMSVTVTELLLLRYPPAMTTAYMPYVVCSYHSNINKYFFPRWRGELNGD